MKNSGNSNRTASSITGGCNKSSVNIPGGNAWTTICENSSGELQIVVGTGSAWNNNIQVRCTAPSSSSSGNGGSSSSGTAEPPPSQNFTENLNGLSSSRKPLDMVYVQGGTYIRGCTDGDSRCSNSYSGYANEIPRHNVTLSDFLVAKYELTNAQWNAVMGSSGGDDTPKTNITWYDAIDFTCEIGKKTGKKYRLLTDAEFEFAARGGTQTSGYYWSGSNTACDVAQVEGCVSGSGFGGHAVGGKSSNELGLYDMSGNVYEWVFDNWGGGTYTDYSGVSSSGGNLTNPVIEHYHGQKTRRGGSYDQLSEDSRVSARKIRSIEGADGSIGLRLALSADGSYPVGMTNPCDIHAPEIVGTKKGYRDERLITASGQTWEGTTGMDASKMVLLSNGAAAAAGYLLGTGSYGMNNMTGEWYTINNYILHIVSSSGTVKRYMYYMVDNNNMSLMAEGGMPWRFQKKTGTGPSTSGVTVSDRTPEALAQQYSPNGYNINMNSPPTSGRDQRVIEGPNYAWVQDNVAMGAGGTHRYRKDFDDANNMRFVVWDKGQYTGLARGSWFTIDNAFLRVTYTSGSTTKVFDYLYTVSEDENTFYHISFQGYEPGDYRMFTKEPISNEASFGWTNAPSTFSYPYDNREDGTSTYIPPSD
jgi:formylglycine-generating enzyme required for sulfatase activity